MTSDRDTVIGVWDVDLFDVPVKDMDCLMHTYMGLARVIRGRPNALTPCGMETDAGKGAAELRALLVARVKGMLGIAVCEGGTMDVRNMCVSLTLLEGKKVVQPIAKVQSMQSASQVSDQLGVAVMHVLYVI